MNTHVKNLSIFGILLIALTVSQCDKSDKTADIQVNFEYQVAGEELVLDDYRYTSPAGHEFLVSRLKFYFSNLILFNEDGISHSLDQVFYREVGTPNSEAITFKDMPAGKYTTLGFVFGLDENVNIDGGLPNTTTNINMEWPIPGDQGYHYMKFEGKYKSKSDGQIKNFNLHTGATKGNQNYIEVFLSDITANVIDGQWNIKVMLDLNEWMQNPVIYDFETFGPMIMANQDAQEILKLNGNTVFSITSFDKK